MKDLILECVWKKVILTKGACAGWKRAVKRAVRLMGKKAKVDPRNVIYDLPQNGKAIEHKLTLLARSVHSRVPWHFVPM